MLEIAILKRSSIVICVLAITLFLSGCSFAIRYEMRNLSGEPVTIRYQTTDEASLESLPRLLQKGTGNGDQKYAEIPQERVSFSKEDKTIVFTLLPGEEVELFWVNDRSSLSEYEEEFPIETLELAGKDGSVTFQGTMAFKAFAPIRRSFFAYGPEVVGFVLEHK